jgi:anhydro-N-acetylmuramic acid kinase
MMAHPFIKRRPPKTTGREEFGETFLQRVVTLGHRLRLRDEDLIATATACTAATVAAACRRFVFPRLTTKALGQLQIILGGGGAKNPVLRRMLNQRLGAVELLTHEDFGIANAAKEALAFAILAHATLLGQPANVPNATGAGRAVVLGKIIVGRKN